MKQEKSDNKNLIKYQISTFEFAFNGLKNFILHEMKARIHIVAATAAIILGIVFDIRPVEWMMISLAIGFVIATEIVNTAIELIVDQITREHNPIAGLTKDLAAAAVLVASISALAIGLIIFIPKISELL